ncbi:MAG: serine hydrolase domain-containing protein [Gemmatimonadota bacterium]
MTVTAPERRSPFRRALLATLLAIPLPSCGEADGAATGRDGDPDDRIARVEQGLRLAVEAEGTDPLRMSMEERMERWNVPGVAVAVVEEGRVAWARGWGLADLEAGTPVTSGTLFQAASISKPVAALAAMQLVQEGALDLDAPVNEALTSWSLPDNEFTEDSSATLRGLLSHSAGLTVWGFPGYARGEPVPSNAEVLEGEGNTDAVRVYKVPGTSWQYSGGGYTVMEQMMEDVTGQPFDALMATRVLAPAGMERSTYAQPLPDARWADAARGHRANGDEVSGEWHTYPEQAAAGLWTTPEELARLSVHLLGILDGSVEDGVLDRATLEEMLTPHGGGEERYRRHGLGFGLPDADGVRVFSHGGSNEGFKAMWITLRDSQQGVAVMTNGDQGSALAGEIIRAVADVYDWPAYRSRSRPRMVADDALLSELAGEYEMEDQRGLVQLRALDNALAVSVAGVPRGTLWAESADVWYDPEDGSEVRVERDASGRVTALEASSGLRLTPR